MKNASSLLIVYYFMLMVFPFAFHSYISQSVIISNGAFLFNKTNYGVNHGPIESDTIVLYVKG